MKYEIDPHLVKREICSMLKLNLFEFNGFKKTDNLPYGRQLFSFVCYKHTNLSYEKIGKVINRDHATITYSTKKFSQYLSVNEKAKKDLLEIENRIKKNYLIVLEIDLLKLCN